MDQRRQLRARAAQEAARIMIEEGIQDLLSAKRKALARLRLDAAEAMPDNRDVEAALAERRALFHPEHAQLLRRMRGVALEAMRFLEPFQPRLVGPLVSGAVTAHSKIYLHLFAEPPEAVYFHLMEHHIPFQQDERRVKWSRGREERLPMYRFFADDLAIELTVFPLDGVRQAPLSPIDGKPQRRADLREVEGMIREEGMQRA